MHISAVTKGYVSLYIKLPTEFS